MQQDRYSIDIEYCPRDVRPSAKCSNLEGVQTLVLVELDLEEFIVEVSLRSHRDQYYGRTSFSPWNEICVVLKDREEYHGLVGEHSIVVSNMLKIMLMNCGLGVFLIGSQTRKHGFAEHASIRMPSVLLTKIGFLDQSLDLCAILYLAARDLFANFFDPQLVNQKIDSRSGAISVENTNILFISIANSLDYLPGFLTRMICLLPCP